MLLSVFAYPSAMEYHNGNMFTTYDSDNDLSSYNCAARYHGAFWYNYCFLYNPNGRYVFAPTSDLSAMTQASADKSEYKAARSWRMMFRRV